MAELKQESSWGYKNVSKHLVAERGPFRPLNLRWRAADAGKVIALRVMNTCSF